MLAVANISPRATRLVLPTNPFTAFVETGPATSDLPRTACPTVAGHLVEALMSKVGAVMGREGDATPFTEVTVDNISLTLHK